MFININKHEPRGTKHTWISLAQSQPALTSNVFHHIHCTALLISCLHGRSKHTWPLLLTPHFCCSVCARERRCNRISIWPEQKRPAAMENPHRVEGHPDTRRSACRSSSTPRRLWTTKYVTFNEQTKQKHRKVVIYTRWRHPVTQTEVGTLKSPPNPQTHCPMFSVESSKSSNMMSNVLRAEVEK